MFDVSFSELVVIGLVALIVIGPERLPKVARTAGILLGRLQRYVSDVKADINREIQLEELKKMQNSVAEQVRDIGQSVDEHLKTVETELNASIAAGIEEKAAASTAGDAGVGVDANTAAIPAPAAQAPAAATPTAAPVDVAVAPVPTEPAHPAAASSVPSDKPQA